MTYLIGFRDFHTDHSQRKVEPQRNRIRIDRVYRIPELWLEEWKSKPKEGRFWGRTFFEFISKIWSDWNEFETDGNLMILNYLYQNNWNGSQKAEVCSRRHYFVLRDFSWFLSRFHLSRTTLHVTHLLILRLQKRGYKFERWKHCSFLASFFERQNTN